LGGLKIGDRFEVMVPAFNAKTVPVHVTTINVQGQYATWRATRATGDFDLRTFEVRAEPDEKLEALHPGMSAITPVRTLSERLVSTASQLCPGVHQRPCRSLRAFGSPTRSGSGWRRTSLLP
jgi:hypothetical protein